MKLAEEFTFQGHEHVGALETQTSRRDEERGSRVLSPGAWQGARSSGSPEVPTPRVHPGVIPSLEKG